MDKGAPPKIARMDMDKYDEQAVEVLGECSTWDEHGAHTIDLSLFAAALRTADREGAERMRERCAKALEELPAHEWNGDVQACAAAIRALKGENDD